jgi:hypothetical protein
MNDLTHPEINLRGEFLFTTRFWTLINAEKKAKISVSLRALRQRPKLDSGLVMFDSHRR